MGYIMSIYKIYPEDPEDIEKIVEVLKKGLPEPFRVQTGDIRVEPIAFGLSLIRIGVVFPDKIDGLLDKLEGLLKEIPGVRELETEGSTLIS
jgi:translation elongation factor EF-1beta